MALDDATVRPPPAPHPRAREGIPTAVQAGIALGLGLALVLAVGAFWVPGLVLKSALFALGVTCAAVAWIVRCYFAAGDACELPVSSYHQRYSER